MIWTGVRTAIISDVHMGSRFFLCDRFDRFLRELPPGVELVLNGDTVDRWHATLPPRHQQSLDLLVAESRRRRVVWVRGNHDEGYKLANPGDILFQEDHRVGSELYIAHGDDFDNIMPRNRLFIRTFRLLHIVRIKLGANAVHVAHYAKRFHRLYLVLRRSVAMNAVEYAEENGYEAVTCGHTHYAEDRLIEGIRYLNTGSWTELPLWCVTVTDRDLARQRIED